MIEKEANLLGGLREKKVFNLDEMKAISLLEPKINGTLDIISLILNQYEILKPKYDLKDAIEKQKILDSIAELDPGLA